MSADAPKQDRSVATPVVECDAADRLRRTADVVVSSLLLVLFLVPMLLIAVAIHLEDKGPAFFRQERVGLGAGRFTLFKFRTMFRGGDDRELRELIARELRGEDTVENGSSKLPGVEQMTTCAWLGK